MNDLIDKAQEGVMAPRKTTAGTERGTSRKAQDAAGDQAGLVALTTTLLAGAVTGAVAGLVEDAEARHPHHAPVALSPEAITDRHDGIEPEQAPYGVEASAGDVGTVSVVHSPEAIRTEASQGTQTDPAVSSSISDTSHQPAVDAGMISPLADPAGSRAVSPTGEGMSATTHAPVAEMPALTSVGATSSGSSVAEERSEVVSSIGSHQATRLIDDISSRLDHAIAGIGDRLAESVAAIGAGPIDGVRTLDEVRETLDVNVDAVLAQIGGQVSRFTDAIDNIADSFTDAITKTPLAVIPESILGADRDGQKPDGLLAELFDANTVAPSSEAPPARINDTIDIARGVVSDHANRPVFSADMILDQTSAIDAVKIAFAGQSYSESSEAHDSPAGSHANLLHGLF